MRSLAIVWIILLCAPFAQAGGIYEYTPHTEVIGVNQIHILSIKENLVEVALQYGLGYNEIHDANPSLDPWTAPAGSKVILPLRFVLPSSAQKEGIVINLAELRLYGYFDYAEGRRIVSYPIGIGSDKFQTPEGEYWIISRHIRPTWNVPESIRKENPALPAQVEPGEDNPLGKYALRLSNPSYLIHGTNKPFGVGRKISHGCIRLYPGDIRELYTLAYPGTKVTIVYEPIKVGRRGNQVFIEVHKDYRGEIENPIMYAMKLLSRNASVSTINLGSLKTALQEARGIAVALDEAGAPSARVSP